MDEEGAVQYLFNLRQKESDNKDLQLSVKKRSRLSPSEKAELEDQIRDLFKMDCDICSDVKFRSLMDAQKHYRNVHQKGGYLICCGKKFNNTGKVVQHIRHHIDLKANGLPEAEAQIREWFSMKCDICTETVEFQTLLEVRRHYTNVHNTRGYLRGTCCDKKLYSRAAMLNHIRWYTNSDTLRCDQCDKIFSCRFSLKIHIANHTPRNLRAFKCSLCTSRFASAASLRAHVKNIHTLKTGEKFDCDKCTKR